MRPIEMALDSQGRVSMAPGFPLSIVPTKPPISSTSPGNDAKQRSSLE